MGSKGLYVLVITCGIVIDVIQVGIGLSLAGITFMAGGALQLIPVVGTTAGGIVSGAGMMLAYVVSFVVGMGGGALLITLLVYGRILSPVAVLATIVGETMPLLNAFPGWTALAVRCVWRDHNKQKSLGSSSYDAPAIA